MPEKRFTICAWIMAATLSLPALSMASPETRINPDTDLVYLGAFRVPDDKSGDTSWDYGGGGLTFNPDGDPTGAADGFPGSLFGIGKAANGKVSEYAIPKPVISNKLADLPFATAIQGFQDITGGRIGGTLTTYRMGDLELIKKTGAMPEDKLFWVIYEYYMPEYDLLTFGWSTLNLSAPKPEGLARIDNDVSSATSRYIFKIPPEWANINTNGRSIAVGRDRGQMNGSWGPTLFAIDPTQYSSIMDGTLINSTPMMRYSETNPFPSPGWSHGADDWNDGAWLGINGRSAVIIAGSKGIRTDENGLLYYGDPGPDGCGDKGYHAEPNYAAILFYDPDDFAQVAKGTILPHEIKHYALYNVEKYMFKRFTCRQTILGGVGYDQSNQILYIEERLVGSGLSIYSTSPIVHVWRIVDSQNTAIDTIPPTKPTNIVVTDLSATEKRISWTASSDNSGAIYYLVYRNNLPIIMTTATEHIDTKFSLITDTTDFTYHVEARDQMNNSSLSKMSPTIKTIIKK